MSTSAITLQYTLWLAQVCLFIACMGCLWQLEGSGGGGSWLSTYCPMAAQRLSRDCPCIKMNDQLLVSYWLGASHHHLTRIWALCEQFADDPETVWRLSAYHSHMAGVTAGCSSHPTWRPPVWEHEQGTYCASPILTSLMRVWNHLWGTIKKCKKTSWPSLAVNSHRPF